jgi:RHS repeat-associated protein
VGKSQYQTDSDSGLQLLGHRYYDPSIGRFLSSDPAQAGTNWYAYCDNNPVVSIDSTGLDYTIDPSFGNDTGKIKKAIELIRTKGGDTGKQLGSRLDNPVGIIKHIIIKKGPNDQGNFKSDDPETYIITLDPGKLPPYTDTGGKKHQASLPRVIAHEIGHIKLIDGGQLSTGGEAEGKVIKRYENPVAKAIGEPQRR